MKKIRNGVFGLGVLASLLIASGAGYISQSGNKTVQLLTSRASAISSKSKPAPVLPTASADMNQAINNDPSLEAAASLIDLDNGKEYDAGLSSTVFQAASTAKVLAAVDYLHEVEQGDATLAQNMGGVSAQQELKQMIEVSDNTAWLNINEFLGSQQESYAHSIGLSSYTGDDGYNTLTSAEEASLLEQLYQGKLINSTHRALLYSYMSNTNSTNLIQAALPDSATVYHKYGQLGGELHDAAIVTSQGHHFVLVIYTKNPDNTADDYDGQVALIHAITTATFNDITAN